MENPQAALGSTRGQMVDARDFDQFLMSGRTYPKSYEKKNFRMGEGGKRLAFEIGNGNQCNAV